MPCLDNKYLFYLFEKLIYHTKKANTRIGEKMEIVT